MKQIMRWDRTVLRESPWYQEIWQEAEQSGVQKGEQRLRRVLLSGIAMGLKFRFDVEGLQLLTEIRELENVDQLERIHDAIATANTLEELRQLY